MNNSIKHSGIIFLLSAVLAVLIIFTSLTGIFTPDFYSKEKVNWQIQSNGQDIIDLLILAPALLVTSIFAFRGSRIAGILRGGIFLYAGYTFAIFCFNIHFNKLFILYCFEFGLSFYLLMHFLFSLFKREHSEQLSNEIIYKVTGIYFVMISLIFFLLWMSEILPSVINDSTPQILIETGLFTNPVHVLDLSVFLPGIFMTGVFLLRRNATAGYLAPAILVFFVLMDITIAFLIVLMENERTQLNFPLIIIMSFLALFSLGILIRLLKKVQT